MALTQQEIQRIHSNKLATPNRKYYGDDGKVYIGNSNKRLQLIQTIDDVPIVNPLSKNIETTKDLKSLIGAVYDLIPKIKEVEIDFGKTASQKTKIFTIIDADITSASKIQASVAYKAPSGKSLDELEMDAIEIKAGNSITGQFQILAKGLEGSLHDKFKITYTIL